jgi:hypothetical protein
LQEDEKTKLRRNQLIDENVKKKNNIEVKRMKNIERKCE